MRQPALLLLLAAALLASRAAAHSINGKGKGSHAKQDAHGYGHKGAADDFYKVVYPQQPKPGPAPAPAAGYGAHSDSYSSHECDGCPNPQPAEDVTNAYVGHYTFLWSELAKEYADGRKRQQQQQQQQQGRPPSAQDIQDPLLSHLGLSRRLGSSRQRGSADKAAQRSRVAAMTAADTAAAVTAAVTAAGAAGSGNSSSSSSTAVHTAAVTDPSFLLPTNPEYHEHGFEGNTDKVIPSSEAIAVGPHPSDPESVLVMAGAKRAFEVYSATRDGRKVSSKVPTKIPTLLIAEKMGYPAGVAPGNFITVTNEAFYDKADNRYVLVFSSVYAGFTSTETDPVAPLFVCVSASNNPLGKWTCWAIDGRPVVQRSPMCTGLAPWRFHANFPRATYSEHGLFISTGAICWEGPGVAQSLQMALYAFPKRVLYTTPATSSSGSNGGSSGGSSGGGRRRSDNGTTAEPDPVVWRASYFPDSAWYRSLPTKDQLLEFDADPIPEAEGINPLDTWLLPAKPQDREDVPDPVFVIGKVNGNRYMSFAKLTPVSWDDMHSRETAPRIYATVLAKPDDFTNVPPFTYEDDIPHANIPQPGPAAPLQVNDVFRYGKTYGATKYQGRVYVATTEFFGALDDRTPSIFWAIVDSSHTLCHPTLLDWGVVASEQRLSLAFPVITGRREGGALVVFAYGGNNSLRLDGQTLPAYAGAGSAVVGCAPVREEITVVKHGEVLVTAGTPPSPPPDFVQRWGDYSAVDILDGTAWFAVPVALKDVQYGSWISNQRVG